jgi:A/G-specific adenine glycosylase
LTCLTPAACSRLLAWFDAHHRPLPFRESRDAYRIWVSEVMLQQTTVAAVVPYFQRFVKRFPTVTDLAKADEAEVLALWEGLGYYRRVKHLHAAAKILASHGNDLPDDPAIWAELPGVGRYILGAVLSQAFDRRLPIVEANTLRLLSRLFGYRDDPRSSAGQKWLWATAEAILPKRRIGDFNQALMELGALVCTPTNPKCGDCPLRRNCIARKTDAVKDIPPKPKPTTVTNVVEVVLVARRGETLLLGHRPDGIRWAGLWELPHGEIAAGETIAEAAKRLGRELLGVTVRAGDIGEVVKQQVTRFAISLTPVTVTFRGNPNARFHTSLDWVAPAAAKRLAMPVAMRRLVTI